MSDKEIIKKIEEAFRIKKPKVLNSKRSAFLNSSTFDCQDCYNVITTYQNPNELIFANALTGYTNTVQMPSGYGAQGHIAKFDNTFWINVGAIINEFTIGANCNITHVRTIDISSLSSMSVGAWEVAGLCAMDMNTLIIGTFIDINDNEGVHLLDITPGVQPSTTHLFYHGLIPNHPGGPIAGDIAYLPASNTVVTITGTSNSTFTAYHHDMSGGLLGSSLVVTNPLQTGAAGPFNAWSFDDKAYLSTVNNPGSQNYVTYEFDLTSYTLIPHTPTVIGYGDAASSPSPCAQPSGECYDIGDTGPEGGTIFAVPLGHPQNNGVNQTNFYYEVAKNDIATGGTPSGGYGQTCGTPGLGGWSTSGAEWGVHNKPNIVTSTDFGTGHKNTDAIDAYPLSPGNPTGGIHPWLDSHDIAATLCKQQPSAKDDWFLPSLDEFAEMVDASVLYNFNLGLNTQSPQDMRHVYWTSSQWRNDPANGFVIADPDLYSWGYQVPGGGLQSTPNLAYRCHALSVRPIRRFECKPDPCEVNPTCDCVEYNWRDLYWWTPITGGGGLVGHLGSASGPIPGMPLGIADSWMGGDNIRITMGATDVMGNEWTLADWQDDSIGYTITLWDRWYNYLGKWKYDNFVQGQTTGNPNPHPLLPEGLDLNLSGVTHLDGPSPFVDYTIGPTGGNIGSTTKAFFKIEAACNTNLSTAFENGCNHIYPPDPQDGANSIPYVCLHENAPAGWYGPPCAPSYGTFSPPTYYQAATSCYQSGCEPCDYQIGDTGPGGGIIVATPWMNINSPSDGCVGPITPALQGMTLKNYTDYYYEISPENLNDGDYIEFGNSGINLSNNSSYVTPDTNVVYCPPSNLPSGQVASIENIGQGEQATQDIMATTSGNPMFSLPIVGFTTPIQPVSAFEACDNYSSNGYNDWFLPTTYEMEFARNYSPPGTLGSTLPASWESNMITNSANGPLPNAYWTCNAEISTTTTLNRTTNFDPNFPQNTGFAVSGDSFAGNAGPNGYGYRWRVNRGYPLNVRAMRKFKCDNNSPIANNRRSKFVQKKLQTKEVGPFGVAGYYPLYGTIEGATKASPESSYHIHEFEGFEYYMPNGLEMGKTQFHGDWKPIINTEDFNIGGGVDYASLDQLQPEEQVIQPEQQRIILPDKPEETPPSVFIPEPEPDTEPTYIPPPPPSTPSGGSGGGGY